MMKLETIAALFPDLDVIELTTWIEHRWVRPQYDELDVWTFHDIDIARVRLIYDLRRNLDVPEDTLPMMLSLLDQLYDLRRKLSAVSDAVADHPPELRNQILTIIRTTDH
jgi:chaperone modulatory protein CbpM